MLDVTSVKVSVPLKKKFRVAKGSAEIKTNLITLLNNRYPGEASGSVYYGPSIEELEADVIIGIEKLSKLDKVDLSTLDEIASWDICSTAKSALVSMTLNYISGETKRYPWEVLELGSPVGIKSSFTIAIDTPEKMMEAILGCDYPIIKLKMGNEEDLLMLDLIDKIKDRVIRVDANGGWSCAKAEEMIFNLSQKGVKIIEQPTEAQYVSEWPHLKGKSENVELLMDEGLCTVEDFNENKDYIDGINIKMEKSGGIVEATKIARVARKENKKVMLGCMVESSVGIAQSVYMSSEADYFDLDGPLLLEDDIARGILYDRESIAVDREIIGGPKLKRDVLQKYIKP